MKTTLTLLAILLISISSLAQNGINYKAVIKDINGNVVANQTIDVQFIILQGAINVYQETHSPTTDDNGIVIVNIGEGTSSDEFADIDWASDQHFLNVQIDIGSGLVDLGTTQFMHVPYAKLAEKAANVTGLEAIDEGVGTGWRLIARDTTRYGTIGINAIDLSYSTSISETNGATSQNSFAAGYNTEASSIYATAFCNATQASGAASFAANSNTEADGTSSSAFGNNSQALGQASFAAGTGTLAQARYSMAVGMYNLGSGNPTSTIPTDPIFEVGNGSHQVSRGNALTVLKNGNVGIGTHNPQELLHVSGRLRIGTETIEDTGSNRLSFNASLIPDADNAMSLGASGERWTSVWAIDGTINTSDRRDKTNIASLNYGLKEVMKLQPVSFNWKNNVTADKKLGLIAQDLLQVIPEVVKTHEVVKINETGKTERREVDRLGVYYSDLIPVLIKALQEQQCIIDAQNEKIEAQTLENTQQNTNIESLLQRMYALEVVNNK